MLPRPATACWSSSTPLIGRARPSSRARSIERVSSSTRGSGPRRPSSGTSTAARAGSNTTTSPNVRGSTNHSSSPPLSTMATWVCGGRGAPAVASRSWPLMRRWNMTASPESSGATRYLPRRPAAVIVVPVRPSITASRDVRRTVRSRPTSTRSMRRPTTCSSRPRRTTSTSGSSGIVADRAAATRSWCRAGRARGGAGHGPVARGAVGRGVTVDADLLDDLLDGAHQVVEGLPGRRLLGLLLAPALTPPPHPTVDLRLGVEVLGVVGSLVAHLVDRRALEQADGQLLQRGLVVETAEHADRGGD